MRVLVACEYSGTVRDAFLRRGHDAVSCDLLPTESDHPERHHVGDALALLDQDWDLLIAHPPCTYMAWAGARWLYTDGERNEERWDALKSAAEFFRAFLEATIPRIAVENPVMLNHAKIIIGRGEPAHPTQSIQPWQFGHDASKRTCLWLRNLPPLEPTKIITKADGEKYANQTPTGQNKLGPSADRWKLRSATYAGIAEAMADQWGSLE